MLNVRKQGHAAGVQRLFKGGYFERWTLAKMVQDKQTIVFTY
jgi:hypothetical protein